MQQDGCICYQSMDEDAQESQRLLAIYPEKNVCQQRLEVTCHILIFLLTQTDADYFIFWFQKIDKTKPL